MGRDEFSCLVLRELYEAKDVWKDITIATLPDVHVGRRGSVLSISPLKILGEELKIPVHTIPKEKRDFKTWQLPPPFSAEPENLPPLNHLLISASFGRILTGKMLNSFQHSRRLNVHPSLLPSYRGPAPIQHTILNNEKEAGVCVIEMLKKSEGIDTGSLWGCQRMPVPPDVTFEGLRDSLAVKGGKLLVSVLRDAMVGKATALAQPPAEDAPRASFITAKDAHVDFETMTAEVIHRRFRAISHQKPLFTYTPDGKPLQLRQFAPINLESSALVNLSSRPGETVLSKSDKMLLIRCAADTVLGVTKVKPEGKPDRNAGEFWRGLRAVKEGAKQVVFGTSVDRGLL
ncbi:formyl transferase [Gymnopilus junonius]|uniref:methionyl-tRNA formyltransferase n=1 Tax=Gymnopilus junonius TaxID=109634 RepID=A0A9P5TJK7_GYMJU|nr:formyl transferase [Gymnopilus junonius]